MNQHGEVAGFYVLVTDVTALATTRLQLQESNAALRAALDRAQSRGADAG